MKRKLDLAKHKILKDKNIKPETKEIYAYLYSQGFNKTITHVEIYNKSYQLQMLDLEIT